MNDRIQMVLAALLGLVFGLSALARRFPHVAWLRRFRDAFPRPTEAERERIRRRSNVYAGAQLILLGIALPLMYGAATVMFFNDFTAKGITLAFGAAALCIGLGAAAIWQGVRR